jgi:hypothetical protein
VSNGSLPAGLQINPATGAITGTPTNPGPAAFTIAVSDANQQTGSAPYSLTINPPPSVPTQNLPAASPGASYSQNVSGSGGTPSYTWSASGLAGSGFSLSGGGALTGVPTATPPATVSFTASLTDAAGATAQGNVSITIAPGLSITTGNLPATTSTAHHTATLAAAGGTGAVTLAANNLPGWLSLGSNGALSGTAPVVAFPTAFGFVATATDSLGVAVSKPFTITVNPQPRILTVTLPAGTAGASYAYQLAAAGGTGPLVWSAQNLPSWASLNPSSGVISGTPSAASTTIVSAIVTDSLQIASGPASLTLTISATGGTPSITTPCPLAPTTAGLSYSATATATGGFPPYSWSATGQSAWLTLSQTGAFSGTAAEGIAAFALELTDSHGQAATRGCSLAVNPAPATSSVLPPGTVGGPYAHRLSASGGTGPLTWSASVLPAWLNLNALTGMLTGSPPFAGTFNLTLQVTDALGAVFTPAPLAILVTNPGGVPVITACPLPLVSAGFASSFQLIAALGFPPYSRSVSGLPGGLNASATGAISGTPLAAGSASVAMTVTDSANHATSRTCPMYVGGGLRVTTTALPNGMVSALYSQTLFAAGGVRALQWSGAGIPSWLGLNPGTGELSGTPPAAGSYSFSVQASDSLGNVSPSVTLSLNVVPPGGALSVTTGCSLPDLTQSMALTTAFTAISGTTPYAWTASGLPSGISLSSSGDLSGIPAVGTISFSVQVTDQQRLTVSKACSINVNPKPTITTSSLPDGFAGTPYSAAVGASGGSGSLVWGGSVSDWLSIDPASGALTGIPPSGGSASAFVSVTDANGISDSKTFSYNIASQQSASGTPASPFPALTTACALPGATAGIGYLLNQTAAGGAPPYQFFVSGLPQGLTFSSSGGITGTAVTGGTVRVLVEVIDSRGNSATATCSLTVAPPLPLHVTGTTPDGKTGQSYSGAFSATGGVPPFVWSIASGSLPPGVSLDLASGALSGTPTAPGTYTFQAKVTDLGLSSTSIAAKINIAAGLQIGTPSSLPDATGGVSYRQALVASGASGTVTWSIVSGALPDGLTLDPSAGVISGAATQAGSFQVTLQAADAAGQQARQQFTLAVNLAPLPRLTITGLSDPASPSQQLTASITLAAAYPLDITGQLTLSVSPDASVGMVDPAVQFASGGNTVSFRIPANSLQAVFTQLPSLQTGTIAGTLKLDVAVQAGGVSAPLPSSAAITGQIPKLAPVLVGSPSVARTNGGIQLTIIAFATSREVTSATFHFSGTNVQSADLTVPLSSLTGGWFNDPQFCRIRKRAENRPAIRGAGRGLPDHGRHRHADEFHRQFDAGHHHLLVQAPTTAHSPPEA